MKIFADHDELASLKAVLFIGFYMVLLAMPCTWTPVNYHLLAIPGHSCIAIMVPQDSLLNHSVWLC